VVAVAAVETDGCATGARGGAAIAGPTSGRWPPAAAGMGGVVTADEGIPWGRVVARAVTPAAPGLGGVAVAGGWPRSAASRLYCGSVCSQAAGESPGGRGRGSATLGVSTGAGTSGSSSVRVGFSASPGGGRPTKTSRERRASVGVPPGGVGVRDAVPERGAAPGALRKPLPGDGANGREGASGGVTRAVGGAFPVLAGRVLGWAGVLWRRAGARGGGRLPAGAAGAAGVTGRGAPVGGKRLLTAKGHVPPLGPVGCGKGATGSGRSGARGAPARMRSSGVASRVPGVAGVRGAAAGGVPGRVKWRAGPGWLGGTWAAGGAATGRVKPAVGRGPGSLGAAVSGGPS